MTQQEINRRNKAIEKIEKAKNIIAEIYSLTHIHIDGYTPSGYGNFELNKATDAMYNYIKEIESEQDGCNWCSRERNKPKVI